MSTALKQRPVADRVVENAVRFIERRLEHHRFELSMEVGEHLFRNLYKSDRRLLTGGGEWKKRAIARIAADPRVKVSCNKLYQCIHVYLLVEEFGRTAPNLVIPDLSPWKWEALWPLEGDPDALVRVAVWAEEHGAGRRLLRDVAQLVEPYMETGGSLDDLLVGDEEEPNPDTPYRRISRFLAMAEKWLERDAALYMPETRKRVIGIVERLLARCEAG